MEKRRWKLFHTRRSCKGWGELVGLLWWESDYVCGTVLEGKLPQRQYRMLSGWLAIHEEELYEAWNKAVREIPFDKIKPLE